MVAAVSGVLLDFDSAWFGLKVGRYDNAPAMAATWAAEERLDLVYCLLPIDQISQVREASQAGWKLVDVRVEFVCDELRPWGAPVRFGRPRARPALPSDLGWMQDLALAAFTGTRFYNDRRLNRGRVDEMYANWTEEALAAGSAFVANTAGFVTVDGNHDVGLIAVHPSARRTGVGSNLMQTVVAEAFDAGASSCRVVTQGGNIAAQRTFQGCGFRSDRVGLWLHRWM